MTEKQPRCPICGGWVYPEYTMITDTKIMKCSHCGEVLDEDNVNRSRVDELNKRLGRDGMK